LATVTEQVTSALNAFHYSEAARELYDFAWDEFCSFYVEMIKTRLSDPATRPAAQRILAQVLDVLVRLLHPFTPFITEEIWQRLGEAAPVRGLKSPIAAGESVMVAPWPTPDGANRDARIEAQFAKFKAVLGGLREVRSRQNIVPKTPIKFSVRTNAETEALLKPMAPYFASMAGATATAWGQDITAPPLAANFAAAGCEVFFDLAEHIDVGAEIARNEREAEKHRQLVAAKQKKLANEQFISRAPAEVVQAERASLAEFEARLAAIEKAIADLKKR
jgi:valyl-tRNA synthetase